MKALEDQIIAKLKRINRLSSKQLHDLLVREGIEGKRKVASKCPLARMLGGGKRVSVGSFEVRCDGYVLPTTPGMAEFIHDFDAGKYPDLEEKTVRRVKRVRAKRRSSGSAKKPVRRTAGIKKHIYRY